jgi:hypothetical protein
MVNHDLLGVSASSIQIFVFNCCKYHICIYAGLDLLADNYELIGHYGIYHPWVDAKGARLLFGCVCELENLGNLNENWQSSVLR